MPLLKKILLCAVLICAAKALWAQDGAIDPTFNPGDIGFGSGDGAVPGVWSTTLQSDGKVIVGGDFVKYNSVNNSNRIRVARLSPDGVLDTGFTPGAGADAVVRTTAMQSDGKIIIGGSFTSYDGIGRNSIARLNADGSLDIGFNPGTGANNPVHSITLQPDGKIIIGGDFTNYNGTGRNRVARLNTDGSLDTGFNPGIGANSTVYSTLLQADGKIITCGSFTSYNGSSRNRIARLNTNGSLDLTFNPGTGANDQVNCMALDAAGKVTIGGLFGSYNGMARARVARLNANGTLDTGFDIGTGANGTVLSMALRPDGKVIIAGSFTAFNGTNRNYIARLNTDGGLDAGFDPGLGTYPNVHCIALQPDGKIIIGGEFTKEQTGRNGVARLNTNGSLDLTFNPSNEADAAVSTVSLQSDGKIIIGGYFTWYNETRCRHIARLHPDGGLDTGFNTGTGTDLVSGGVFSTIVQPDGKILIGGEFSFYNNTSRNRIARLNGDGSLDTGFDPGTGVGAGVGIRVEAMALQADGKIIIAGQFNQYNGTPANNIARLNADGSLDPGFNPGTGTDQIVYSVRIQPNGKIIIGGRFASFNGVTRGRVARLNADGSLDPTFDPGPGEAFSAVYCADLQPDGKVMVGGAFSTFSGVPRMCIARLNADGTVDPTFDPGTGTSGGWPRSIVHQPDGKILIGGWFTSYNGVSCKRLARLNADGSLDLSFNTGTAADEYIFSLALRPDGRIIAGGWFTNYNGVGRNRIARIHGTSRTSVRLMLDGPYAGGMMNDALRTLPSFPLTEPFTSMGYSHAAYAPGATIPSSLLAVTGNNAIVDWLLIEMRPAASPSTIAASRAVLLQRDGDVVDLDGVSTVGFAGLAPGSYSVAVRPRNHLPVMLSSSTPIAYGDAIASVDFTLPGAQVYDNDARKNVSGVMVLAAGDVTFDHSVKYAGGNNDRDPILTRIGGTVPTATVSGYWLEDVNLDGVVKYAGSSNDRDRVLNSIGGSVPTAMRVATLP
ncbi:MAG: delta-60 repeat domain-containing protein [Flavobacteriales bacterium]|nr:delta-60 repeat domain-containing protein [Flavobacteriales bacterium]